MAIKTRSRTSPPYRTRNHLDTSEKLTAFKVHLDTGHPLLMELEAISETVYRSPVKATLEHLLMLKRSRKEEDLLLSRISGQVSSTSNHTCFSAVWRTRTNESN